MNVFLTFGHLFSTIGKIIFYVLVFILEIWNFIPDVREFNLALRIILRLPNCNQDVKNGYETDGSVELDNMHTILTNNFNKKFC